MDFTPDPMILLQTHGFYSEPINFTPDPWIFLETNGFYSEFMEFNMNLL